MADLATYRHGRVKGNIYALRVKLRDTAVVEGDIYHRSLSIDENACFEGWSRPEDNLPEPPSTLEVSSDLPPERQTLIAFDQKGEFKGESSGEELYQPRGRGTRVFLASCIAAIAISVMGYFALRAIDPSWIWRLAESHYTALRPTAREHRRSRRSRSTNQSLRRKRKSTWANSRRRSRTQNPYNSRKTLRWY